MNSFYPDFTSTFSFGFADDFLVGIHDLPEDIHPIINSDKDDKEPDDDETCWPFVEEHMDNFYNSVTLAKILLDQQTYTTGTLLPTRKFNLTCY